MLWVVLGIVLCAAIVAALALKRFGVLRPGNGPQYALGRVKPLAESPLRGKRILFLGSSVTFGAASLGVSFVEQLARRHGFTAVKEAVSGTTLADTGPDCYVRRMLTRLDGAAKADGFVCQLSTNDASRGLPLGEVSTGMELSGFDTGTVTGAMEYILCYVRQTWGCPVVFYTGTRYPGEAYGAMVARLLELQRKWGCGVINLWDDEPLNRIDEARRKLYMADDIHPTRAGYLLWWGPKIEEGLLRSLAPKTP
jgi:lysophospholipase L1-like esterase